MKIECESVGFKNFLSFGSKFQDVSFKNGLNFVVGMDKDRDKSNGAGKSSFLEAPVFALFGKTAREIKIDQIVNWRNRKKCEVVFRFKINDDMYEVLRALKPNKYEIYKNGSLIDQDSDKRVYQENFNENIFGMDYKIFMSLVHSNVNSSANILSMSKPEKRKFMEKMFGLEIFSKMNDICNKKLSSIESKVSEAELKVKNELEKIDNAKKTKKSFEDQIKNIDQYNDDLDKLKEQLKDLQSDNPKLEEKIEKCGEMIKERERKKSEVSIEIRNLREELEIANKNKSIVERNKEIKKEIKDIEKKHGSYDILKKAKDKLNSDLREEKNKLSNELKEKKDKLNNELKEARDKSQDTINKITECKTNLKILRKNQELLKDGICPVCNNKIESPEDHYKDEIKNIEKNEKKLNECLQKEENMVESISSKIDKIEETISIKINKTEDNFYKKISEVENIISSFYELSNKIKEVESNKDVNELDNKIEELKKKRRSLKRELETLENKKRDLDESQSKIDSKKSEIRNAENKIEAEKEAARKFDKLIKDQDKIINEAENISKDISNSIKKFTNIKDYLNAIKEIVKDENIKQYAISQVMPYLNQQANFYLSEVDYSFYINIDKWLDVKIKGAGITEKASYGNLSGGEKRGIDLAIQLGFLDIARVQSDRFPDISIFDELLDSSIDSKGMTEVLKIIKVKQKESNNKTFVISHRQDIESDLIDNMYTVIKENGFSRIIT